MASNFLPKYSPTLTALASSLLLASCGGGGEGAAAGYSGSTNPTTSTTLTTNNLTKLTAALTTNITKGNTTADYTSYSSSVSFGAASYTAAAATAYNQSQKANSQSYNKIIANVGQLAFDSYPIYGTDSTRSYSARNNSSTANQLSRALNYNELYVQGLLPVMFGKSVEDYYIPLTQAADTNFKQQAKLSKDATNFRGSGVKVSIIDGVLNASHGGLSSHSLQEITIDEQYKGITEDAKTVLGISTVYDSTQEQAVRVNTDHGTKVALILTGKRDSQYSGLLPNATVSYTQLTQGSTNFFDKIYQKIYNNFKPSIINNSYSFGDPNKTELKTNVNGLENVDRSSYVSAIAGLKEVTKYADTPLFVFTTGNSKATEWYKEQYTNNNNIVSTNNWSDINWGATVTKDSGLYHALQNSNVNNAVIAVTGWTLNPYNKVSDAVNTTKNSVTTNGASKLSTSSSSDSTTISFNPSLVILGTSGTSGSLSRAIGCGEVKWSCIAGAYGFNIAKYTDNSLYYFTGTSAAAPQISAIAGMVKEQFSFMTASNLKTTLLTTAYDIGVPGVDEVFGWGVVDAAMALNGPASFVFGNFTANLSETNKRFYFNNNITGSNGLIIKGKSNLDQLVLTGANNSYTGATIVDGGALILQDKVSLGMVNTTNAFSNNRVKLTSNVYINRNGHFHAYNATVNGKVVNNGYTEVENATFSSLENKENATLAINLAAPLKVQGTAQLAGTLAITNAKTYVKAGTTVNYTALTAANVTGNFSKYYVGSDAALANYTLFSNATNVVLEIQAKSATSYVRSSLGSLTSADANSLTAGADVVDQLLTAADKVVLVSSTAPSSNSQLNAESTLTTGAQLSPIAVTSVSPESSNQGVTTASYYANLDLTDVYTNSTTAASAAAVTTSLQEDTTAQAASTANELALVNSVTTADSQTTLTTTASLTTDTTPNTTAATVVTSQSTLTELTTASPTTQTSQVITTPTPQASSVSTTTAASPTSTPTLTADNGSTLLATAATIQNLNAQELNALLYRAAGTLYANSQLAVAQANYEQSLGFAKVATSRLATTDHDWHTYANYSYNRDAWDSKATTAKGRLSINEVTIGAYTQTLDGFNLGVAVHTAKRKWQEGRNDAQNLSDAYADINSFGLTFSAGKAYANYYLAGTLFIDANLFKVDRTVLNANDLHARFNSYTAGADLKGGFLAIGNLDDGVVVEGGIAYLMDRQSAFSETAASTTSTLLAFQAKARTNSQLYAHTAVKAYSSFKVFGLVSQVDATLDLNARLAGSAFALKLQNGATTGTAFNNKFLARLELGYAIQVTNGLKLRLAGAYAKAAAWSRKQAGLSLDYKF